MRERNDLTPASVIVDVSSISHAIGDLNRTHRQQVDCSALIDVLTECGFQPTSIRCAIAGDVIVTSATNDIALAERIVGANLQWFENERRTCTIPMLPLIGGHDGEREIGVDDMIVAAALIEAARIRSDPQRLGECVLVLTHDGDMSHLAGLAAPVPLFLMGLFKFPKNSKSLGPRVSLSTSQMNRIAHNRSELKPSDNFDSWRSETHLAESPPPLPIHRTSAIVDAYGIACSAATVLGIAKLPSVGSIKDLLRAHGVAVEDLALLVTIPDIINRSTSTNPLETAKANAWRFRDHELDLLAREIDRDGSSSTLQRRAVLNTARIPSNFESRLDRSGPIRAAKRLATQLTADLIQVILDDTSENVVLITDSPHVAWVQSKLHDLLGSKDVGVSVTRWGLTAAPFLTLRSTDVTTLPAAEFMVLTEQRVAKLVRVGSHVGRSARQHLMETVSSQGSSDHQWKVVSYDPEIDGIRMRAIEDPALEFAIADGLTLGLKPGETIDRLPAHIELRFEPSLPVSMPVMTPQDGHHGSAVGHLEGGRVIGRTGSLISFDLDGDGDVDVELDVVTDLRPIRPEASALLGKLMSPTTGHERWIYISSPDDSPHKPPVIVKVVDIDGGRVRVAPRSELISDRLARSGFLQSPPNSPPVDVGVDDILWAVDTAADDSEATWVALSTPLKLERHDPHAPDGVPSP